MATQQHAGNAKKTLWGKLLVIFGFVALIADSAVLAQPFERLVEKLSEGLFSLLPTVGLSFMHAARAFAFHQIDYFSLISRILVLFTAMVALVVGSALWKSTPANPAHPDLLHSASFREQETDNG
jgi:ascorbate-specific PTS system EIIC-type component UlaA